MNERFDPKFYHDLGRTIRAQIRKEYSADSCIATTAATVSALRLLGADVFPLSVEVVVMNTVLYDYAVAHEGAFPDKEGPDYPPGGYALAVTRHVAAVAERRWLLDYSIDQAQREDVGILLEPLVIPIEEKWLRGRGGHLVFRHRGTILYYTARPGDRWFEDSNNWKGENRPSVQINEQKSENRRAKHKRGLIR